MALSIWMGFRRMPSCIVEAKSIILLASGFCYICTQLFGLAAERKPDHMLLLAAELETSWPACDACCVPTTSKIGHPGDMCLLWDAEVRGARINGLKATRIEQG